MNPFPRFLAVLVALSAAARDNATHPMNPVASLEVAPGGPNAQGRPLTAGSSFRVGRDRDGGWEHPRRSVAPRLASGATAPRVQLAAIRTR